MSNRWMLLSLFVLYCCSFTLNASCYFHEGPGYQTSTQKLTMPISGTISVPANTPVGAEIYRQKIHIQNQSNVNIQCSSIGQYWYTYTYYSNPALVSGYTDVYQTGFTGIGIRFSTNSDGGGNFPYTAASGYCVNTNDCNWNGGFTAGSWFSLIKTADNIAPGYVTGNKLPTVTYSLGQTGSGNMVRIYNIVMTGKLNITTPTCDISPVSKTMTVIMGNYKITRFSGTGSATDWKNASIQLENCGVFFGNSEGSNTTATFDGATTTLNPLKANSLKITLTPLNGVRNASDGAKGIMKIDDIQSKATGIGIQLSSTESVSGLINLANPTIQPLPQNGQDRVIVPLYARYIQNENSVIAGKANGRLEYVITYQ